MNLFCCLTALIVPPRGAIVNHWSPLILCGAILLSGLGLPGHSHAAISINTSSTEVISTVKPGIYSHFLEHIQHSVHGGLWGEIIWNRSFEEPSLEGFDLEENKLTLTPKLSRNYLLLGQSQWHDYDYHVDFKKNAGAGEILLLFRHQNPSQGYTLRLNGVINGRHALEKLGQHGQIQQLATAPGRLTPGQWHHVRIQCQGPHIQCWLNHALLLDYTDLRQPYLKGKIGMAVDNSYAQFKDPHLTDPNGLMLVDKLIPCLPRYWHPQKTGDACLDTERYFNSTTSLCLTGPGAAIRQTSLNIVAQETYQGSLWVQGGTRSQLTVRLIDGARVLAEQTLDSSHLEWTQLPLIFNPQSSSPSGSLEIVNSGLGPVWIDQVSVMPDSAMHTGGFNPNLLRILSELAPTMIRWPGGYFVTHYHWKEAIGPQQQRQTCRDQIWDDRDTNAFGVDEFMRLCRTLRSEPIIVVNSHPPKGATEEEVAALLQDTLDLMQYCNGPDHTPWGGIRSQNGHEQPYEVKYWELDDIVTYNQLPLALRWARAMKSAYPDINLMVDAHFGTSPEIQSLNREALQQLGPWIDYVSIEHYPDPSEYRSDIQVWERYIKQLRGIIAESPNPNIKVMVSEWNLFSGDWRNGLYAACLLNLFERHSDVVEITSPAILMRHTSGWGDHTLIQFDQSHWFGNPCYQVWKLWHDFYAPERLELTGPIPPNLDIVATRSEDHEWIYLKVVNPSENPETLELTLPENADQRHIQQWMIRARPEQHNSLPSPNTITPVYHDLNLAESTAALDIPAYSVHVFCLKLMP